MTFAGTHQAIAYGGISFVTTAHAAITAHCQIRTHDIIFAHVQIRTSSSTIIGHLLTFSKRHISRHLLPFFLAYKKLTQNIYVDICFVE